MIVKAMRAVKLVATPIVTPGASVVAVMAAVAAVLEASAVTVRKAGQKVAVNNVQRADPKGAQASAVNAAQTSAVTSNAASNAVNNVATCAVNNDLKARSSASHAHRVSRVNRAKAAGQSAHAVSAANAASEAAISARQWTPPSKTLPWPTKPPWLQPWAAQLPTQAKKRHAANAKIVVQGAVVETNAAMNHAASAKTLQMPRQRTRQLT